MEVRKRVLVIGINCLPELTGIGKYTGEMVTWLAENGYETTVITTFPYYPEWKVQSPYSGKFYKKETLLNGSLSIYRCPIYVPAKPTGIKRLLHEASFLFSAFLVVVGLLFKRKHDVVFTVAPPFHTGFLGLFYRFFRGGTLIYHIQDLQIDAARDLQMLKPQWLFSVLFRFEKMILKRTDYVSSISDGMIKKISAKVDREILFFPNWVDTDFFYPVKEAGSLKKHWGFNSNDKVILYSGSIGKKQGLDMLLRVAGELTDIPEIKFVICGTGPYKERLLGRARKAGLDNVFFFPLQEISQFNEFLNMADLHLVLQKGHASDLVMPSKLTTILSCGGLVLVTANPGTSLADIVSLHKMGAVIPPEDECLLKETIKELAFADSEIYKVNARQYALKYLKKENILSSILEILFGEKQSVRQIMKFDVDLISRVKTEVEVK